MNSLWTGSEFADAVGGTVPNGLPVAISGISIDSRTVGKGDAFFAIRGDRLDGHDFVEDALGKGASIAVVSETGKKMVAGSEDRLLILKDDPLDGLVRLAAAARARSRAKIVAITGSVGKTSTRAMAEIVLSTAGSTHASVGSFNNHWGVPLSLARLPANAQFGVFEIGMNNAGEITPLTRLVRPDIAIVTNVEAVHSAQFSSIEAIAEAKAEIFLGLQPGGTAILNRDNRWFNLLARRAIEAQGRVLAFGQSPDADFVLDRCVLTDGVTSVQALHFGKPIIYKIGAPGSHFAMNSLAVLAAAEAVGANLAKSALALASFRAPPGRGDRKTLTHPGGSFVLIDESYNASPVSMGAALDVLKKTRPGSQGRRLAVLGDMLELGTDSQAEHRNVAGLAVEMGADQVFLVGPRMKSAWEALPDSARGAYAENADGLEPILLKAVGPGDVLMIKASHGTGLGSLVKSLLRRFGSETMNEKESAMPDARVRP